jgi:hypothetical protein
MARAGPAQCAFGPARLRLQLRKFLGEDGVNVGPVQTCAGGYLIEADPGDIDCFRFEQLVRERSRLLEAEDYVATAQTLTEALDLWHGPTLHGLLDSLALRFTAS